MALFEVPGWTMPSAPMTDIAQRSGKRKRPSDASKVQSAEVNLEKLMKKLKKNGASTSPQAKGKTTRKIPDPSTARSKEKGSRPKGDGSRKAVGGKVKQKISGPTEKHPISTEDTTGSPPSSKRQVKKDSQAQSKNLSKKSSSSQIAGLTTLQNNMKQSLDGARFRWINEVLYKSDSAHAHNMMRVDRNVFDEYHKGFRHQVESWPSNPVSHYISILSSYPPKTVIADLGCGDAALARSLIPKGFIVLSFDLVSDGAFVTEADIFGRLPLPGSETDEKEEVSQSTEGHGQITDVVICALSLMGTNWPNCIREAWRVLRSGGELKIAEVASRFTDISEFTSLVCSFGFKLKSSDDRNTHFTLFEFRKVGRGSRSDSEWEELLSKGNVLKPCEYKRR